MKHCPWFAESTNYKFILPSNTCQRHLKRKAANGWDLVQSDQSPFNTSLFVFAVFFTVNTHHTLTGQAFIWHLTIGATLSLFAKYYKRLRRIPTSLPWRILTSHIVLCTTWKSEADPGRAMGTIEPQKNYKSNFVRHDFLQLGKQHSRYKAILPSIVLSQHCCEVYFIPLTVAKPLPDLTAKYYWNLPPPSLTGWILPGEIKLA